MAKKPKYQPGKPSPAVRKALDAIVEYAWEPELEDYLEQPPEVREHHVFTHLVRLHNYLTGQRDKPSDWLPEEDKEE